MTWRSTRLKYLAALPITNGLGEAAQDSDPSWPRYIRTTDIASPRHLHADRRVSLPPETARPSMVRAHDLLMCAAGSLGKVYLHQGEEPACYAGYLVRFRPRLDLVDPRFIAYWAESQPFLDQIAVGAVRSTIDNFSAGKYQQMRLDVPSLDEQRRIADFLDVETRRIDRLVDLRQRQVVLLDERPLTLLRQLVAGDDVRWLPLRRALTFLADGPFGSAFSSDDYTDEGAAVVRLGNIGFATYREEAQAYIPRAIWAAFPRCHVASGDLLIAGLGDSNNHAGRACVAPDLGNALVKGKCFVAHVDDRVASAPYLALLLSSSVGRDVLTLEAQGSTRAMINLEIVKSAVLPLPPRSVQDRVVVLVEEAASLGTSLRSSALRQVALLQERRQALVTAAVTGQLDVTTARGVA